MQFSSARELFESARAASEDAERIQRQLAQMQQHAATTGSGTPTGFHAGYARSDRMESRVIAMIETEERLRRRLEDDYAIIDRAHALLYGKDNDSGLSALVDPWKCDAACLHYINGMTYEQVGEILGYSANHCWREVKAALQVADAHGMARDRARQPGNRAG